VTRPAVFEIEKENDVCIVRISGRVATGAGVDKLRTKAQEIKRMGCSKLIADIRELDSIGSAGIGFFVDLHTSMTKDIAGRFVLVGPSPRVLEVLALTGLSTVIHIVKDLEAGLAYCAREEGTQQQGKS
jgi:anti-anti-sigma factor